MDLGENGCHVEAGEMSPGVSAMQSFHPFFASGRTQKRLLYLILAIVAGLATVKTSRPILEHFLIVSKPLPQADALVVMAGSASERLPVAARLFHDGLGSRILLTNDGIFSAWSPKEHRNLYDIEWAERELLQLQVPRQDIVKLAYAASGSIHDALQARREIVREGIRSIIIVTSDYHTRRTLWTFQRVLRHQEVAIGIYPAPSAAGASSDWRRFLELSSELIKYGYYRLAYEEIE